MRAPAFDYGRCVGARRGGGGGGPGGASAEATTSLNVRAVWQSPRAGPSYEPDALRGTGIDDGIAVVLELLATPVLERDSRELLAETIALDRVALGGLEGEPSEARREDVE
jgi:hypothetical protein